MSVNRSVITRRLAAILIADVVGFSRHMERDDAGTLARLREIREQLIDPKISEHGGHVVKTAGDGMLLEFGSADAALRCAVDVQRAMAARNEPQTADDRIEVRIGINLGDIIVDGNDIAGDGVNVAARLETSAEPGGICVSAAVHDQVHGNLDVGFYDIGEQQVKNIVRPIRAFAVALEPATAHPSAMGQPDGASSRVARVASSAPPAMSVGVTPLVALPAGASTSLWAETLTRDLTSILARASSMIRAIHVPVVQMKGKGRSGIGAVARSLNVRYLLEGDVRPRQDATLISLRLMNGATSEQLWSETVSLKEADPTNEQMRAMRAAVDHLLRSLSDVEIRRVMAQPTADSTAMDYVLRALALWRTEPDTLQRAREQERLYEEALRRDANLVPALIGFTIALDYELADDIHVDRERVVRRMDELTSRAVNLSGADPWSWEARARALMYMGQWDASLEASAKAIRLDPDSRRLISHRAWLVTLSGRPAEALTLIEQAIAMDPPGGWFEMLNSCWAHLLLGQYAQAITACEKAKGLSVEDWWVDMFLAAAYAHYGDPAKAAAAKREMLRRVPGYTIATLKAKSYSVNPDYIRLAEEHWYSGLRKAGFPENTALEGAALWLPPGKYPLSNRDGIQAPLLCTLATTLATRAKGQLMAAHRPSDERRNATQSSRAKRNAGIFYSLDQVDRRAAKRRGENAMIAPRWRRVRLETQVTPRLLTPGCSSRRISPQAPNARPVWYTGLMHRLKPMCSVKG